MDYSGYLNQANFDPLAVVASSTPSDVTSSFYGDLGGCGSNQMMTGYGRYPHHSASAVTGHSGSGGNGSVSPNSSMRSAYGAPGGGLSSAAQAAAVAACGVIGRSGLDPHHRATSAAMFASSMNLNSKYLVPEKVQSS